MPVLVPLGQISKDDNARPASAAIVTTAPYWDLYRNEEIDVPRVAPIPPPQLDPHSLRLWEAFHYNQHTMTREDALPPERPVQYSPEAAMGRYRPISPN